MTRLGLAVLLAACAPTGGGNGSRGDTNDGGGSGDDSGTSDASVATDAMDGVDALAPDGAPPPLPDNVFVTDYVANIVNPEAAASVERFLVRQSAPDLHAASRAFYEVFGDDYDFLYVFTQRQIDDAPGGVFRRAKTPDIPEIGLMGPSADFEFGSDGRLRGAVAVNFFDGGNGPTIHETGHNWGVFLDRRFGFGVDRDMDFGAHWGLASVNGQLGGFAPGAIECVDPAGQPPPCEVDENGDQHITIASFGPSANGGDGVPYAPLELYLMGLIPSAEVPSPILVVEEAHFVEFDPATERLLMTARGFHDVTVEEIVEFHGERPPAREADRHFCAAFVLFSDERLPEADMARLETWAKVFGNVEPSGFLQSFESATGGRATMDVRLGTPR